MTHLKLLLWPCIQPQAQPSWPQGGVCQSLQL
jgi:hypothetical protein